MSCFKVSALPPFWKYSTASPFGGMFGGASQRTSFANGTSALATLCIKVRPFSIIIRPKDNLSASQYQKRITEICLARATWQGDCIREKTPW